MKISKENTKDILFLTPLQEGILFHYLKDPNERLYFVQLSVEVEGTVKFNYFQEAWNKVVANNEMLRTVFRWEKLNKPVQVILKEKSADIKYNDLSKEESTIESKYQNIKLKDIEESFDLREVPFRLTLCKLAHDKYNLLISNHHIIYDGWSNGIILKEFLNYYIELVTGSSLKVNKKASFKNYLKLNRELSTEDESFWKDYLIGCEPKSVFSFKRSGSLTDNSNNQSHKFSITEDKFSKLKQVCKLQRLTIADILYGAWGILLSKYSGETDILFGTTISGRNIKFEGIERMVGLFINTIPLRIRITPDKPLISLLKENAKQILERGKFENVPLLNILDYSGYKENDLIESIFVVENYPLDKENLQKQDELAFRSFSIKETTNYKLTVGALISNEIEISFNYIDAYFESELIENIGTHYVRIIDRIIDDNKSTMQSLDILSEKEKYQLLYEFNNTETDYPKDKTIHQLFEEQVEKTPKNIAVVFENKQLTYRELNKKTNQLAHFLLSKEVKPDSLVGICVERSLEMIVGLLGILKAGGAYVPIDPTYPKDRISYMLEDAECGIVLSQEHLKLPKTNSEIIYLDVGWDKIENDPIENVKSEVRSNNLAYVIYTSGSTGKPKGVMLEHAGICNLQQEQIKIFNIDENDIILQFASFSFDASVSEIFMSLSKSAKLVLCKEEKLSDVEELTKIINDYNISVVTLPPTMLNLLSSNLSTLKTVISAGETCTQKLVRKWTKNVAFYNAYGPTENTVCASTYECNIIDVGSLSIGKAIGNNKLYVLDNNSNLVPIGVPGELCISGAGIARGYLKRPELTAEKFIKNPFNNDPNSRLYKTGDLVKYLPSGNIEFIGRIDNQVKISGFRIELGEIESALNKLEAIQDCVVVAKEDVNGNKRLVAYIVSDNELNVQEIRDDLYKSLPNYMVPSLFESLEKMPLSPNGKIDRKALPDPEMKAGEDYIAPSSEIEEMLVEIWAGVLNINKNEISINKSFFELGGNSLLSIKLKQELSQLDEFKHITIPDLFKYHTINLLGKSIQQNKSTEYKLQNNTRNSNHEIAIIGMSGAFSGVSNIAEFWQLIKNQDEGIRFYSKDECEKLGVDITSLENPDYIPVTGKVKDVELFDSLFWEISPNEAKLIDPQIRKFIEHCWFALESSGYIHQRKDYNIGVFAGSGVENYFYSNILNGEMASQVNLWEASHANSKDALATKTSYMLGLSGPANSINTACSTGLVSVVEACKNLHLGTCDMALAGGVSLSMPNQIGYTYQEGMISSKDGHCRTFDEDASGTTGGSGVGVVLLKRLEDAIENNDNIIGVVKGYSTNNDGDRKTSYTAPSVTGQAECIISAQKMAGIASGEIEYVECHGTATNMGDPVEVQALREAFEFNRLKGFNPKHKTVLGAVKANIGHADSAAGIAGLIKACLMLQNNIIPGQPNFSTPNPKLNIEQTIFEITKVNKKWLPNTNKQRIAGVSSFGIGGTNAHVIIGDYTPNSHNQTESGSSSLPSKKEQGGLVNFVVPISAKCKQSLELYKQQLIKYLTETNMHSLSIEDIAYTLQERREHFNYRSAYCAKNIDELINNLKLDSSFEHVNTEFKDKIVFMFPGQGSQYTCMAKELYNNEQFFKTTIDKLISLANHNLDVNLYEVMYPDEGHTQYDINETQWAQISLFIIEYALAKYLEYLGIRPDAYIGHSIGEYTAATLSGVFTLEDAIKIVIARGKLMQSMHSGSMLAINAKEESIYTIVEGHKCEIAVINSIDDIVVSGDDTAIKTLKYTLDKRAIPSVILNTSHAYHSKMMENAANEFENVFNNIKLNKPRKIFISNLTGEIANEEVIKASYWCNQLRNTVQFAKGINSLAKKYNYKISFIELGAGKGLSSFVTKYKKINDKKAIQSIQLFPSIKENTQTFRNIECKEDILAKLWVSGIIEKSNDLKLFEQAGTLADLPTYQFNFKKCWLETNNDNVLNTQLKILPKEKWLYTPVWSAISNLNKLSNNKALFKNALVFIRKDQLNSFDFSSLARDIHFIVLDTNELQLEDIGKSNQLFFNMKDEYHFKKIAEHLKNKSIKYDAIIHASSINNLSNLNNALSYSFYSLFLIHKYLINGSHLKNVLVLTNGLVQITNEDIINPTNGTLVGAIRNINHEFPKIDARVIDIGHDKRSITSFINQVINDETYKKSEELLAIRFGKLWKENFERIDNSLSEANLIEDGDIILITGGLGGVALAAAKYISIKHKVTFILVSRNDIYKGTNPSDYIKQKIEIIEEIKANGSVIDIQNVDISNVQQVLELKDQIENKYGNIRGIIHTAGITPLTIDKYNLDNVKNAFKGKVYGIYNLINTLNLNSSKYIISTSSLASIMGDVNRIEYCASNSYLDYLSVDKVGLKNTKMLSINWPGWSDIGMVKEGSINIGEDERQLQGLHKLIHLNSVKQNEGAEIFYQLINQSKYDQVIISKLDIKGLKNKLFIKEQTFNQDIQLTINKENFTETEFKIAQIWCQVLGVEEISICDNFFELGGHSLLATQVISKIRNEFNIELPLKTLFEKPDLLNFSKIIENTKSENVIEIIENVEEVEWDTIKGFSKTFEI